MFLVLLLLLSIFIPPGQTFLLKPTSRTSSHLSSSSSSSSASTPATIRECTNEDIPKVAQFLAQYLYGDLPAGQRRELAYLEQTDLYDRYGEKVGKRKLPASLLILEEGRELVGAVGLDCQFLDRKAKQLRKIRKYEEMKGEMEVVVVLSNLAIKSTKRKRGLAKFLLKAAEAIAQESNLPAQSLYRSRGYRELFVDRFATAVGSTITGLTTAQVTNLCLFKRLDSSGGGGGGGGAQNLLGQLFGETVEAVTKTLLHHDFQILWKGLPGFLSPPLPNRLNYLCYLYDLITTTAFLYPPPPAPAPAPPISEGGQSLPSTFPAAVHILDIGTGANVIYPLLGTRLYTNWQFSGSDVNPTALRHATENVQANPRLAHHINLLPAVPPSHSLQCALSHYIQIVVNRRDRSKTSRDSLEGDVVMEEEEDNDVMEQEQEEEGSIPTTLLNYLTCYGEREGGGGVEWLMKEQQRGPIRMAMAAMNEIIAHRLVDVEHLHFTRLLREHQRRKRASTEERPGKRRGQDLHYHDDEEEEQEEEEEELPNYTPLITAVMTNPPFYDIHESIDSKIVMEEEVEGIAGGGGGGQQLPGTLEEMRTTGGELSFLTAFIVDSLLLRGSILWYTAMVGKKASISVLKSILLAEGLDEEQIVIFTLTQGVTYRWVIAWTFLRPAARLYQIKAIVVSSLPPPRPLPLGGEGSISDDTPSSSSSALPLPQLQFLLELSSETLKTTSLIEEIARATREAVVSTIPRPYYYFLLAWQRVVTILSSLQEVLRGQHYYHGHLTKLTEASFVLPIGVVKTMPWEVEVVLETLDNDDGGSSSGGGGGGVVVEGIPIVRWRCHVNAVFTIPSATSSSTNEMHTTRLLTFVVKLSCRPTTSEQTMPVDMKEVGGAYPLIAEVEVVLARSRCEGSLVSRIFSRVREYVEAEFLRSNRRWRRALQRELKI
eukprot:gene4098-4486_t